MKEQERIDDSLNHIARNEFAAELLYIIQRAEDFCTISKSNTYDENGDPLSSLGMSLVQGPKWVILLDKYHRRSYFCGVVWLLFFR